MQTHKHLRRPKRTDKTGLPPGRMVYIGDKANGPVRITLFDYDANGLVEQEMKNAADCEAYNTNTRTLRLG
jgi:hypothetical protein